MIAYNAQHKLMNIGTPIHEGGEGWICPIIGQPAKLAKIYKHQNRAGLEAKLRWMIANSPYDPGQSIGHASIAWPETLLYDEHDTFIGYVMPRIKNTRTLLQVYNPRLRAQSMPGCDGLFLYRVARNLASAVGALHKRNYVIGDLNESNILVTPQALVTVIDTDSFQTKEEIDGQIIFYPCPVGRPEYTPPELLGKRFQGEVRQPEQDAFSLAVLLFQILFGGSHPFRAVWLGTGAPPPVEERIYLGLFPYYQASARGQVAPPPNLLFEQLHPPLENLMLRCFVEGHHSPKRRPSPTEWEFTLKEAEKYLRTCPNRHVIAGHLKKCPQCGVKMMPAPVKTTTQGGTLKVTFKVAPQPPPLHSPQPPMAPTIVTQTCTVCKTPISATTLYCPNCSSPIDPKHCAHCGFKQVPQRANCCPRCGKPT